MRDAAEYDGAPGDDRGWGESAGRDRVRPDPGGVNEMVNARRVWENLFVDGNASVRIVESILGMKF